MKEHTIRRLRKTATGLLIIFFVPLLISLLANLITWRYLRDKTEVTFKLDGWISIGNLIKGADVPNLKLLLDSKPVNSILKISWRIINTGNKGIKDFEDNPRIIAPKNWTPFFARISDSSPQVNINKHITLSDNSAVVDSMGIFNPGDYFVIDMYFKDRSDAIINRPFFDTWHITAKSVDLTIKKDILSSSQIRVQEDDFDRQLDQIKNAPRWAVSLWILICIILLWFIMVT